ncbi:hypothetical protein [Hydrogenimonas sp. SS33]|uniref:hypothetical protein n=1 Tax=Hydrogenimonas leucolamina TaxID=2954236 RepID=UPI00336BD807
MKLYYYIHTGHRVGLDRLRRSAPVINALKELGLEVTLLTSDFRAGEYAKEQFGIRKYVSVDVVRNIANIATPADALIFDSQEEHRAMWEEMADYFRRFIRVSDDPEDFMTKEDGLVASMAEGEGILTVDIVDPRYFSSTSHDGGNIYFWGDDDYEKKLLQLSDAFEGLDITLLEGYYFFFQYGDELAAKFAGVEESESYDDLLMGASRFLTSSLQSALEALAAGSSPIYLPKPGAPRAGSEKCEKLGIPVIESFQKEAIAKKLNETLIYSDESLRNDASIETALYIKDKLS